MEVGEALQSCVNLFKVIIFAQSCDEMEEADRTGRRKSEVSFRKGKVV